MTALAYEQRVYTNAGNADLLALLPRTVYARVLDVGCGDGANAALLRKNCQPQRIVGVTRSAAEAAAATSLDECVVADIENGVPPALRNEWFDLILFSHVLEHTSDPWRTLGNFSELLAPGGDLLVALPNALFWRQRLKFLRGSFDYEAHGPMDETHLRFFTPASAQGLLRHAPTLKIVESTVTGSAPLWILRRHLLPHFLRRAIDNWSGRTFPGLFGAQILIRATRLDGSR